MTLDWNINGRVFAVNTNKFGLNVAIMSISQVLLNALLGLGEGFPGTRRELRESIMKSLRQYPLLVAEVTRCHMEELGQGPLFDDSVESHCDPKSLSQNWDYCVRNMSQGEALMYVSST